MVANTFRRLRRREPEPGPGANSGPGAPAPAAVAAPRTPAAAGPVPVADTPPTAAPATAEPPTAEPLTPVSPTAEPAPVSPMSTVGPVPAAERAAVRALAGRSTPGGHRAGAQPGVLVGTVASSDGWPLPDATVTVLEGSGRQVGFAVSDDSGVFAAEVGAHGAVTVVIAVAGSEPVARAAQIAAGQRFDLGDVVLAAAGGLAVPTSGRWSLDPAHSIVRATARHIGLARVEGRFTDFAGELVFNDPLETSVVEVTIQAASITTGNEQRDQHLRSADFLDVERFPLLTYRGDSLVRHPGERATVSGELTIRDVTRSVPLRVTYLGSGPDPWGGTRTAFTATTQLARRDYEISWNMGLPGGMTVVGPTLQIDLDIEAVLVD